MNVLIVYLQPKDGLEKIREELRKIPCDKIILKYFPYPDVYRIALQAIRANTKYSHILWLQNDILLTKEDYFKMCESLNTSGGAILGASMNVDLSPKGLELCAFTDEPFIFSERGGFILDDPPYVKKGKHNGIITVFHNGGPFICSREFYLKYPLKGFENTGYNADLCHGIELASNEIKYFLDTNINLKHFRYAGKMMVGRKEPKIEYECY